MKHVHLSTTMEREMATQSSTLARKIPWMEEPGRLQSMGLQRVGHDWETSLTHFILFHRRRKWQPTPVFLPGKSHGQRVPMAGYSPWGCRESDTTRMIKHASTTNLIKKSNTILRNNVFVNCAFYNFII